MKRPMLLHYYITNKCNARCAFCEIWRETEKVDAQLDDVMNNLKHARAAGCKFVDFTGGEPLLHPQLPEFLRAAKKLKFITSVTTNAILFEKRASELAGLVDLLHISIDADTPELHNKIRGCDSYHHAIRGIDAAIANRLYPDILFTYTEENIDSISGILKIAQEKKIMLILDPVFSTSATRDNVPDHVHARALDFAKKNRGVYLNEAHIMLRRSGGNNIARPMCRAVTSTVVITPDDHLALPCFHHQFAKLKIGGELDKLLKSEARRDAIKKQGSYCFCVRCHINCYFDPSYQYVCNRYTFASLKNKFLYAVRKHVFYKRPLFVKSL